MCGDGIVDAGEGCDDGNLVDGDCCSSSCLLEADGSACDDGNLCTQTDVCLAGVCTGGDPVVCTPIDACHASTCDPGTGLCVDSVMPDPALLTFLPVADAYTDFDAPGANFGSEVDLRVDGRPGRRIYMRFDVSGITDMPIQSAVLRMTTTDESPAGSDHGGDVHLVSDNSWDEATLTHDNRPEIDGPLLASAGTVEVSETIEFDVTAALAEDGSYSFGIEAASNNMAIYHSREDTVGRPALVVTIYAPCDDGDECTQLDNCVSGSCVGTDPVVCAALDQCHEAGTCDSETGLCSNPEKLDGTECDDEDACTVTDLCTGGVCGGTGASPDGTECTDGDACTQVDTCVGGVCVGTDPVICEASGQCHDVGVCDPATGECSDPEKPDGTPCDDDNACTQTDTCIEGSCEGANPVVCPEADQCHETRKCKKSTGVCSNKKKDDGEACDDGNACTQTDRCDDGECVGSDPVACTALDQCHAPGICDPTSGVCSNPPAADGKPCDDGDRCTSQEVCTSGACVGEPAPDSDEDGICDALDLCVDFPDAAQIDADNDGIGDFCQCTSPAPGRCLPGGGSKKTDCLLEIASAGPLSFNKKGNKLKGVLTCSDGDPLCDMDGSADGQCTFGVAFCFANADPRFASCEPAAVESFEVLRPKAPKSSVAERLEEAMASLGLEVRRRKRVVTEATAPVDANVCSPMVRLPVASAASAKKGKAVKSKFRLRASAANGKRDVDQFVLICQ